ncbi:MAG: DUF4255 domain-containing protein [Methanotrichaceae archaeon]|nr:DUF4255 domain-containing protein [Methanotrichaceae archaeon]
MSNSLAVATVTATICRMLQSYVADDVEDVEVKVSPGRPDGTDAAAINVFLYRITPNTGLSNANLPLRDSDGRLIKRPLVALDLHYLFTFYGAEAKLEPQRLLGSAVAAMQSTPVLSRRAIQDTIGDVAYLFLSGSDLAEQVEAVKFTPENLSLDELSKLWSSFYQAKYALSLAYTATVVLIEGRSIPEVSLPVVERRAVSIPSSLPKIVAVRPNIAEISTNEIEVLGERLLGDDTIVLLSGMVGSIDSESTSRRLIVDLPAGLRAGLNSVQVVHRMDLGRPEPHEVSRSNLAAFVLRPSIQRIDFIGGEHPYIEVEASPDIDPAQKATLLLNLTVPGGLPAAVLNADPREEATDPLHFPATHLSAGTYLARLRVDGAESSLQRDNDSESPTFNMFIGPTVEVP